MRLSPIKSGMKERQSVTAVVAARYRRTGKKDKKTILNEFTQATKDLGSGLQIDLTFQATNEL